MILAEKIIRLRKQFGWSQEDLAEKLNISRQSVSKWESANSIPDLNRILKLAEIFGVSTDYLLKDDIEDVESINIDSPSDVVKISLDEALDYIEEKTSKSKLISVGIFLMIASVIPLFLLMTFSSLNTSKLTFTLAVAIGLLLLFVFVALAITFFIRSGQSNNNFIRFEDEYIELVYGVRSILKEKQAQHKNSYTLMISIGIILFIISPCPLILVSVLGGSQAAVFMMLMVMFLMVGLGIAIIIPASTRHNSYNLLLSEGDYAPSRRQAINRLVKTGSIYWPFVTAIYVGWSLWTMAWGITWIVWPVAGILFASILGIANLFSSAS